MQAKIKSYYYLTKPGIIYGNLLAAVAGFLLASASYLTINILLFIATISGTALIIASSCVFNNYIDRGIDAKMKRTEKRALVKGTIPVNYALTYGFVLGFLGFGILIAFTNWLVVLTGVIGMSFYLIFYSYAKRHSILGTLVGAIPGAMPPVAGYVAVTGKFDLGALLLFLIWVFWQLPHFYAIGTYRLKDYAEAGLPILPVKRGVVITGVHMVICMAIFLIASLLLSVFHYTGIVFFVIMLGVGGWWLVLGLKGFRMEDSVKWGKKVFGFSLIVMMTMCLLLSLNIVLP